MAGRDAVLCSKLCIGDDAAVTALLKPVTEAVVRHQLLIAGMVCGAEHIGLGICGWRSRGEP